jgi:putative ABC transport system permease protein
MIFFNIAVRNVRLHFLRSSLAMLGIVIGVVAVASMGILGNSLVLSVSDTFSQIGDSLIVTPHTGGMGGFGGGSGAGGAIKISEQNFLEIQRVAAPNRAIPVLSGGDRMQIGSENAVAAIYGLDPDDLPYLLPLQEGSYPRGTSGCLVGPTFADQYNLKVGSRIIIGDKGTLRVTGIIEERGLSFDINTDSAVVVAQEWFQRAYDRSDYDSVVVKIDDLSKIDDVKDAIEKKLNTRTDIVDVIDTRQILDSINNAFNQISTFVIAIGGISLIVAGVSILNIMMMSVTERIKEIGIMRSIGAQKREVLLMFLYEALILGIIGSLVGGVLSILGGYVISSLLLQTTQYLFVPSTMFPVLYGIFFGIVICLICGLYPAWRAANLNPIVALRHE